MPPKKPMAGASGSLEPMLAVSTGNVLPCSRASHTVRMSKLALPASRIVLRSSYSAKLSGRKLRACMATPNGMGKVIGDGTCCFQQYSLSRHILDDGARTLQFVSHG